MDCFRCEDQEIVCADCNVYCTEMGERGILPCPECDPKGEKFAEEPVNGHGQFLRRISLELETLIERQQIISYTISPAYFPSPPPNAESVDVSIEVSFPVRERGE